MSTGTPVEDPGQASVSGRRRLLMVMQLPPPLHGHSWMNQAALAAIEACPWIEARVVPMRFNDDMTRIGAFSLRKIFVWLRTAALLFREMVFWRPHAIYFTPCVRGVWPLARDMALIVLIRLFRLPVLHHLHGLGIQDLARRRPWMGRWFRFLFRGSRVVCLGYLQSMDVAGVVDRDPYILPNGIPDASCDCGKRALRGGHDVALLYISHLMRAKGVLDFVEVLGRLVESGVAFRAVIAGGDGDVTRDDLERRVAAAGLSGRVVVAGPVDADAKWALYSNSDLMVFPSRFQESFGLVVVEAMQAGLPVVATAVGGIPEIVEDGITGVLVPMGDVGRMAEGVLRLCRDAGLRLRMGEAGRSRYLRHYTQQQFKSGLIRIVTEVLDECGTSA